MLSIHNSSPLIPQLEISGLKKSSDETPLPSNSPPSFDDNNNVIINKFSIRDYVFNSRHKDIKNSWPFSEKNLQICLKNGVKDLLPPFQSIDYMKNHYNSCVEDEDEVVVVNNDDTQQDHPPIIPINKPENTRPPPPHPVKKCRVVNRLDTSSKELVDTMNFADHAMVSKICPVCKTFSSSSNTTLNAHIDQCLYTESSNDKRATSEPRATATTTTTTTTTRNKIKPRKMRLMVDIYVTARHCTLEELDRRNGTSWATRPVPVRDETIHKASKAHEEKKHPVSKAVVQKDNSSDDGEVYIDSNGTKLRILSKSDDKPVEGCTTNKIPTASKKRLHLRHHHMQKLQKYSKLADPQSKKASFPTSANNLEIPRDPEMNFTSRRSCNLIENPEKLFIAQQKKDRDFTPIKKWACAKRTHFLNRTGRKADTPQKSALDCHSSDDPVIEKRSSNKRIRNSFENSTPISSPESNERMENTYHDKVKQPLNRISSFRGGLKSNSNAAGGGQPNKVRDLHNSSSEKSKKLSSFRSLPGKSSEERINSLKKMRRVTSNITGEGINHSSSLQTVGSLSGTFTNSEFRKECADQTSLSNSLVNPLCLLEDNMSDDHDHLYNENHEMGNIPLMQLQEDHHEVVGNESSYFDGVDPIPIPGPPGSFLPSPSPMDMGGADEELHGFSSLTNSRPESCENHLNRNHVSRDSSDSPTSLASTISSRENFSKVNPHDARNIIVHSEKIDQLCCCARKDQDQNQEFIWKQIKSDDGPDESLKNLKLDPDLMTKFPINGTECSTSVSPSSPNPVLRLMGKNLMVVNKDDNSLIQQQHHHHHRPQWSDSINPVQQQLSVTVDTNTTRNGGSFDHHMAAYQQAPVYNHNLSEYNRVVENQPFDIRAYNHGFDNPISHMSGSFNFVNEPPFRKLASSSTSAYRDHPMKEIIVIDDTPERKTDSGGGGMRQNRVRPNGISIPMLPANNIISSREKILPSYRYHHHQTQNSINHLPYGGILPMPATTTTTTNHNDAFQMPMMRLNRNSEGPSTMQTSLPSTSRHQYPGGNAMLYFSRGFS